jgi:hypothetical protein
LRCRCKPDDHHSPLCSACKKYWRLNSDLEAELGVWAFPVIEEPGQGPPYSEAQKRYLRLYEAVACEDA